MKKLLQKNEMVKVVTLDAEGDWEDVIISRPMTFRRARLLLVETKRKYAKHMHTSSLFSYGDTYEFGIASCQNDRYEMCIISARKR